MIERLTRERADRDAPSTVGSRILQHLQKEWLRQMKAAARRVEQAAGSEKAHRPKIDVLVPAHRRGQGGPRLRESRRIEYDRVEGDSFALFLPQVIERVRLHERDVVERISRRVLGGPQKCRTRRVQRSHMSCLLRQMQREGAVVAETVERSPSRYSSDEMPVFSLIQERARFLSGQRGGQKLDAVLMHFDLAGNV